jgi:hypothetical protein
MLPALVDRGSIAQVPKIAGSSRTVENTKSFLTQCKGHVVPPQLLGDSFWRSSLAFIGHRAFHIEKSESWLNLLHAAILQIAQQSQNDDNLAVTQFSFRNSIAASNHPITSFGL